jgi:hypothetical protein
VGPLKGCLAAVLLALAGGTLACEVPGDGTSLRRALLKVKYLPETEAWESEARKRAPVQYVLSLDEPLDRDGRCYWPVAARSGGKTWNTFYATPRGEHLLVAGPGGALLTLEDWRETIR